MRSIGRKIGVSGGLPGRANATIRSPAVIGIKSPGSGFGTAPSQPQSVDLPGVFVCDHSETAMPRPGRSVQGGRSRSLRLSVRTPPFHGGESGSIPLGSATPPEVRKSGILDGHLNKTENFGRDWPRPDWPVLGYGWAKLTYIHRSRRRPDPPQSSSFRYFRNLA